MAVMVVDARGYACPEPVMMTSRALSSNPKELQVLTDARVANENITRFAEKKGYQVRVEEYEGGYQLTLKK